mmetsp:Transcript_46760/g.119291  ORF Transcript_46760/g.119291 Transcript_46760/m.119291 type:complete len:283 (+) Transcript_46760:70-918(+)|eukprot:jgi/Tetstr1/460089/TSEL_005409.t1
MAPAASAFPGAKLPSQIIDEPTVTPVCTLSRLSSMSEAPSGGIMSRCSSHMSHDGASGDSTTCASPAEVMDMSGFPSHARHVSITSITAPPLGALAGPPLEPLKISLRLHDSTGKSVSVNFDFDTLHDCAQAVAADMASYLSLDAATVPQIARRIEANVAKEKTKLEQAAVMAHAGAIASTLCVAAAEACRSGGSSRRSTDLAAEQHAMLVERHRRRMTGLLAAQARRQPTAAAGPAPLVAAKEEAERRQEAERKQVRFCKFHGMYVPAVIKSTCLPMSMSM